MKAVTKEAACKAKFRREILDAARDLFVNEGYEKFGISKLAKQMGTSPARITLYFKDKDDLLMALCEEVAGRFFADLMNIRATNTDPLESLRQALFYLIAFGSNDPVEYKVLFITSPRVYGPFEEFLERESIARSAYLAFKEIVKNCMNSGKLLDIDIDVLTQVLTLATRGLALTIHKTSFPWLDRTVLSHTLVEGLLRGYRR